MVFRTLAATSLLLTAGCARGADMVPLNDAAALAGIPKLDLTLYGTGYGPATFTMQDGEVLQGHYRLAIGVTFRTGYATAIDPSGSAATATGMVIAKPMNNSFTVQAASNRVRSNICHNSAGGMGHGDSICTMNSGVQYQMMF